MSFHEYLSQQEESTKEREANNILINIDRKKLSNFGGFGINKNVKNLSKSKNKISLEQTNKKLEDNKGNLFLDL